jgi:hypothetical protein
MIAREGREVVEALETDQTPRNYRAEDYRAIRDLYRKRLKDDKAKHRLSMTPCDLIAGVAIHEAMRKAA